MRCLFQGVGWLLGVDEEDVVEGSAASRRNFALAEALRECFRLT